MSNAETLAWYALTTWRVLAFIAIVSLITGWGRDDTDPGEWQRSGMSLYTDAGTGCQYLSRWSGLTPRLNGDGKQMGCR